MSQPDTPVQSTVRSKSASWRRWAARLWGPVVLFSLCAVIFGIVYRLTPVRPYATLGVDEDCRFVLFSPDSRTLVTAGKEDFHGKTGPLRVWDVERGTIRFSVAAECKTIGTVRFSPDSRLFAASEEKSCLKLWSTQTGTEIAAIPVSTRYAGLSFCFSPDSHVLVIQNNNMGLLDEDHLTFWNIDSRQETGTVESYFWPLAFAADGTSVATIGKDKAVNRIMLWKVDERGTPRLAKEHLLPGGDAAISPDLSTVAIANDLPGGKGELTIWDMETGKKQCSMLFNQQATYMQSLFFAANGRILGERWRWYTA